MLTGSLKVSDYACLFVVFYGFVILSALLTIKEVVYVKFYFFTLYSFFPLQIKNDEGWVTLDTMTKFKRLASISSDKAVIAAALRNASSSFIEVLAIVECLVAELSKYGTYIEMVWTLYDEIEWGWLKCMSLKYSSSLLNWKICYFFFYWSVSLEWSAVA